MGILEYSLHPCLGIFLKNSETHPYRIPYLCANFLIMAMMHARLTNPDYGFTVKDEQGHSLFIDIPVEQGGGGGGFRPMQTILSALCGCSGVDVVNILKKQRQAYTKLEIFADGEREKGKDLTIWEKVHLRFELEGPIDPGKVYRAVDLSIEKYCSVAETLRRAGGTVTYSVVVNGEEVKP